MDMSLGTLTRSLRYRRATSPPLGGATSSPLFRYVSAHLIASSATSSSTGLAFTMFSLCLYVRATASSAALSGSPNMASGTVPSHGPSSTICLLLFCASSPFS